MGRTARALVSHEPPARRHTSSSRHPTPLSPQAQNVNQLKTPIFYLPPTSVPKAVQGVVVGVQGDAPAGSASALSVGPLAARTSSLTHVAPPGNHPMGR